MSAVSLHTLHSMLYLQLITHKMPVLHKSASSMSMIEILLCTFLHSSCRAYANTQQSLTPKVHMSAAGILILLVIIGGSPKIAASAA